MELIRTQDPDPVVTAIRDRLCYLAGFDVVDQLDPVTHLNLMDAANELERAHRGPLLWPPANENSSQGLSPTDLHALGDDLAALIDESDDLDLDPLSVAQAARLIRESAEAQG